MKVRPTVSGAKGTRGCLLTAALSVTPDTEFIKALGTTSLLGSGVVVTMGIAQVVNIRTLDISVRRKGY